MTPQQPSSSFPTFISPLKRALIGAGIGLALISLFLFNAGEPNPEWHALWRLKPLIMVPLAGAGGGLWYAFLDSLSAPGTWKKLVTVLLGVIGFIIALWMGTVLGLNGTYWD
jgi:hypothetical protein